MSRVENIVKAYCNGDAQERMDTYLAYPGLRDRFDEIERDEERGSSPGTAEKRNVGLREWLRRHASGWRSSPS